MELLLHPISKQRYDAYISDPPQSILLVAAAGSGKETLLNKLAATILGDHPAGRLYTLVPLEDKKTIGIDQVRDLKVSLRLKSAEKRVVLIPNANLLLEPAQNSLLKLLEEPPTNVHFLIAVDKLDGVLDTIQSRTSIWMLIAPTKGQIESYFTQYPSIRVTKAISIAETRVGLISSLLADDQNHELIYSIDIAKEILQESHFDRLVRVDALSKDAAQTHLLLEALSLVCKAALEHAAAKQLLSVKQWHGRLAKVTSAQQEINQKVQAKLVLSHLFMVL